MPNVQAHMHAQAGARKRCILAGAADNGAAPTPHTHGVCVTKAKDNDTTVNVIERFRLAQSFRNIFHFHKS